MKRRTFVKTFVLAGSSAAIGSSGFVLPPRAWARLWSRDIFSYKSVDDVVRNLFDGQDATTSPAIRISAPTQSNGISVPVSIRTDMDNVETIAIVTESEVSPLAAVVRSPGLVRGYSTRIRVERSSSIAAFVKANGRLYAANTRIKITQGGYGITQ